MGFWKKKHLVLHHWCYEDWLSYFLPYQFSEIFGGGKFFFQNSEKQMNHALDNNILGLHINFSDRSDENSKKKTQQKIP